MIPFIRIAHCPRGPYFKVKGDLILISSDIYHSLSKVLPLQQSLIPVCFKRKLSFTGSYIEEYVEKKKIEMYYSWFSKHNHLFKDIQLNTNLIDNFIEASTASSKEFENNTKDDIEIDQSDEEEDQVTKDISEIFQSDDKQVPDDIDEVLFNKSQPFEPLQSLEDGWTHAQTTMFLNKYGEDCNIPTVANRVADIIVDYESHKEIPIDNEDDFELDDEIINEEEFLKTLDEDLDEMLDCHQYQEQLSDDQDGKDQSSADGEQSEVNKNFDIVEEPLTDILNTHKCVQDEFDNLDIMFNPSEEQTRGLTDKANTQVKNIMKKMEKICVAPGEEGGFNNWGKDVFLEEKAFPEKFPYGTGGYISSCIDDPENDMGFANYCINQIMSCDPKFRKDSSYLFFLLLVKELIQLKRCKTSHKITKSY